MTTLTMEPAAAALASKKSKEAREAFGSAVLNKATSIPTWLKARFATVLSPFARAAKALKIDVAFRAVGGLVSTVWDKVTTASRWVLDLVGLRNLAAYVLTSRGAREWVHAGVERVLNGIGHAGMWLRDQVLHRVPFIGERLGTAEWYVERWIQKGVRYLTWTSEVVLQKVEDNEIGGSAMSLANSGAQIAIADRVLTRFIPATYRRPFLVLGMLLAISRMIKAKWMARDIETEIENAAISEEIHHMSEDLRSDIARAVQEVRDSGDEPRAVITVPADATPAQIHEAAKRADEARKAEQAAKAGERAQQKAQPQKKPAGRR